MVNIKIGNVSKEFVKKKSTTKALEDIDLEIASGEFFGILGSSGSGKTTLMRIIAGLEVPTIGSVTFDDTIVSKDNKINVEVEDRNVGMVFQNWALYPHLTNYENIAFPLRVQRLNQGEISKRVREIADLLDIRAVLGKKPREASGGQQQRVAYARALVKNPSLLLLDEPFSNLDATIKDVARRYTREIQKKLGFTAIIVSHDPADIFSLSNRVGVINKSRIVQVGKPIDVYSAPATVEVARATGEYNILKVELNEKGNAFSANAGEDFVVPIKNNVEMNGSMVKSGILGFRPDEVIVYPIADKDVEVPKGFVECGTAEVAISSYSQGSFRVNLNLNHKDNSFFCLNNTPFPPGEKVKVFIKAGSPCIFYPDTNKIIPSFQ